METWEVVGVDTAATMKIREDNREYKGVTLFLVGDAPQEPAGRYRGRHTHKQFISNERLAKLNVQPMPGDIITIQFDRYGNISEIKIVS